ncbi:MAG TPA: hypothetical protein VFJ51_08300, partial [Nitrososphaeraceae archaeon]|nr:hypothetical protein [Nitrososphaeraceae archaeon]
QQLKMEKKQQKEEIENLRDELNKLKAKGEVWTENKIINVLSLPQLELKITVNCAEKKIEDVEHNLFGLEKYYINNTSQQIENPPACDGVEEQQ